MNSDEMAELRVLLVDDDRSMLKTTADLLALRGIRSEPATSGKEALARARREPPAVALVDLRLPDMDGLELAALLREPPLCTEVIILTGNATVDSAVRALRQQSVDYLIKPVERDDLFRSVERAASRFFRRRAETLLHESEDQLRRIFSAVNDGLIVTESSGEIVRVNAAAARIAGIPGDQLTGLDVDTLLSPSEEDMATGATEAGVVPVPGRERHTDDGREGSADSDFDPSRPADEELREARVVRPDGTVRCVEVAVAAFAPGRFVHTVRDVTTQREVQEELRQAQKMESIGRLAGGVAHDFNNLLTSINGNCEIALLDLTADDPSRACLEEIQSSGRRAANLTRQLLAFSRKQVLQPSNLSLGDVVRRMETLLRPIIGEHIELRFVYGRGVGPVRADRTQVEQVVLNLVVNARDAMPLGGTLSVEVAECTLDRPRQTEHGSISAGEYVCLSVSDTGAGIPAEVRPSIFEPFFTTKATGKGTGLGLATVYGIVRQSGGELTLESEPGEGTTIRMYLPRVEGEAHDEEPVEVLEESEPSLGETILVVEDEETVRMLMVRTLTRLGYRILAAGDGAEALRVFDGHDGDVDLVITDIVMPDMSGTELVERLKAHRTDLPVLYITGYTDDVLVHHEVLSGVTLLEKPFSLPSLATKVRDVLSRAGDASAGHRVDRTFQGRSTG
jgi:two-component system, cell cycle sensor histidine kinase and response regulator CckA